MKNKHHFIPTGLLPFIVFGFLLLSQELFSQIPEYYQTINIQLNGEALKEELHQLITQTHNHELQYTPEVWQTLINADVNPDDTTQILLLYGWNDQDSNVFNDRTRDRWSTCHSSNCYEKWVREHVYPRSKGTPNLEYEGPGSDAHHLRAVDYERNSLRSNYRFTENNTTTNGFSKVININGVSYFYPGDEWKGDIARMVMYMYVRYDLQCQPVNVGRSSITYAPMNDMPDIFLIWNVEDPVSEHERIRNEAVFNAQGNRNPFIDNPFLATKIWNGPVAQNNWSGLSEDHFTEDLIRLIPTIITDSFTIEGIDDTQISSYNLTIYDISGKIVLTKRTERTNDISALATGYYWVKLETASKSKTFRIFKK